VGKGEGLVRKKPLKPKQKTIMINSRGWTLRSHKIGWSKFCTYDKNGNGLISICVGRDGAKRSNRRKLEALIHEILEAILTDDFRRWSDNADASRCIFCFDHDYLNELESKLLTALVSCGMVDPNKKVI
jgi:hypothetical protein